MLDLLFQTRAERQAYRNGISLFFGALLGALLGKSTELPLQDFVRLILFLSAIVLSLQILGSARSRAFALGMLALAAAVLGYAWWSDAWRPPAFDRASFERVIATLGVWLGTALIIELNPIIEPTPPNDKVDLT